MLQIFPAFVFGMWTRWFHPKALLAGWFCGLVAATAMAISTNFAANISLGIGDFKVTGFLGLFALTLNLLIAALLTPILSMAKVHAGIDNTTPGDYA
jgi:SSS family solute:Na+ symporter